MKKILPVGAQRDLEALILDEGPDTVAALFVEPVMGAGGVIIPPKTYFAEIRAVLEKYDVLLVADEVICGFGRTGNMWGSQTMDVRPNANYVQKPCHLLICRFQRLCFQKKYMCQSLSMQNGWESLATALPTQRILFAAAVALRAQELMQERDIIGHVRAISPQFKTRIARLSKFDFIGNERAVGLIVQ